MYTYSINSQSNKINLIEYLVNFISVTGKIEMQVLDEYFLFYSNSSQFIHLMFSLQAGVGLTALLKLWAAASVRRTSCSPDLEMSVTDLRMAVTVLSLACNSGDGNI